MTTLHERLHDLADASPGVPVPPGDLWGRGRRRHRRHQAVGGALALLLAAALTGAATQVLPGSGSEVAPASGEVPLPLLDRLQHPSPWTDGTDESGPIGPLVAVVGAGRGHWWRSSSNGLAGVTVAGDYRFLDLPGLGSMVDVDRTVALSHDGRHLAYPVGGATAEDTDAVAVYDTVTGDVRRHVIASPDGAEVDAVAWAGDTLLANVAVWDGPVRVEDDGSTSQSATLSPTLVWDVREPAPVSTGTLLEISGGTAAGDRLAVSDGTRVTFVDAAGVMSPGPRLPTSAAYGSVVVSPDGSRLAWLEDLDPTVQDGEPQQVVVADLTDPSGTVRRLDHTAYELVGWRDDGHVVARTVTGGTTSLDSVDVADGSAEAVVRLPREGWEPGVLLADDALRGDLTTAPDLPRVVDPRLLSGGGAALALALVAGLVVWRRRARLR